MRPFSAILLMLCLAIIIGAALIQLVFKVGFAG